jgi:hypothetical protein
MTPPPMTRKSDRTLAIRFVLAIGHLHALPIGGVI